MSEFETAPEETETIGEVTYYHSLNQGSLDWDAMRAGMITASGLGLLVTPKLKTANNDKTRQYIYDLAAQRMTGMTGDNFQSYAMMRGHLEEETARDLYSEKYAPVKQCGFVINKHFGFYFGCSPDGLVGNDGMIEIKSRMPKYQIQTITDHMVNVSDTPIPSEYIIQVQTSLFVTGREWCDFLSYCNGFNMVRIRCEPIEEYQEAIALAVVAAENSINSIINQAKSEMKENENVISVPFVDHSEDIIV